MTLDGVVGNAATFIARTGQWWKVRVSDGATVLGIGIAIASWWRINEGFFRTIAINAGLAIAAVVWAWQAFSIRCPRCRLRLVLHAIQTSSVLSWNKRTPEMQRCPSCGYAGPQNNEMQLTSHG